MSAETSEASVIVKLVGADSTERTMHFEPMPSRLRINSYWVLTPISEADAVAHGYRSPQADGEQASSRGGNEP